jgi:hypothetical protein
MQISFIPASYNDDKTKGYAFFSNWNNKNGAWSKQRAQTKITIVPAGNCHVMRQPASVRFLFAGYDIFFA